MKNWYLIIIQLIVINAIATAQITVEGTPASYDVSLSAEIPTIGVPNIPPQIHRTVDKAPARAGYTLPFDFDLSDNGIWEQAGNGFVWRVEVVVPGANALNLYFNNIDLLQGEKLYLYDPQKKITLGAFTSSNNGLFMCTGFVSGDRAIIEFNSSKQYKHLPFSIHEAGVLLADNKHDARDFGDAGHCEVRVNCIEGENWQYEKKGVARILVKQGHGIFWCTGSLINNTKNDGAPYFFTANHCGEHADSTDYAQWLFYFNYESENCSQPAIEPEMNTLSGACLLAHSTPGTSIGSDFKLLLLKNKVPSSYRPYFNGWDRTDDASPSGVSIHHPQGDLKMISTYTSPLVSTKYDDQNEDPNGKYWMVNWDKTVSGHGVTEPGSSGSPIFNNKGYIVGALTGGGASCNYPNEPDYYGKLSYSWESNGNDSTTRLSYWLDPAETGITSLNGTNLDSTNVFARFAGEPKTIFIGESVSFINTSFGNINGHNWHFEGGIPDHSELEEPGNVQYNNAGEYDVRLIVSSAEGTNTLFIKDYIKVLPNISPNPSNGKIKLAFGGKVPDDISIRVFNSIGGETVFQEIERSGNCLIIEILPNNQGLYLIEVSSTEINNTFKIIVDGSQSPTPCN